MLGVIVEYISHVFGSYDLGCDYLIITVCRAMHVCTALGCSNVTPAMLKCGWFANEVGLKFRSFYSNTHFTLSSLNLLKTFIIKQLPQIYMYILLLRVKLATPNFFHNHFDSHIQLLQPLAQFT